MADLVHKVNLTISIRNLAYDPGNNIMFTVLQWDKKANTWVEVARTNMIQNNGNPDFPPFIMEFWFEKK
jgi:hypothetical protein